MRHSEGAVVLEEKALESAATLSSVDSDIGSKANRQDVAFNASRGTRSACICAISVGAALAVACIISGVCVIHSNPDSLAASLKMSAFQQEALSLFINLLLALCTGSMMFVHSVSLRWALYREGRLEYNTNIRIFTSSKRHGPNAWYANAVSLICLILSYGASSLLFLANALDGVDEEAADAYTGFVTDNTEQAISGISLIALGAGLSGQAGIAIWCVLRSGKDVPTWSSNPLNNTLAAIHGHYIQRRPGRCMLSVHQQLGLDSSSKAYPLRKQGNISQTHHSIRYIILLLWTLAIFAAGWTVSIVIALHKIEAADYQTWEFALCWTPLPPSNRHGNNLALSMNPAYNGSNRIVSFGYVTQTILGLLFVSLLQAAQTIALHSAELIVNLCRDESVWRASELKQRRMVNGTQRDTNPFKAALVSWESIVLFLAKAVMHWIIARSMIPSISSDMDAADNFLGIHRIKNPNGISLNFEMIYSRLFIYTIMALALAAFVTYLALRQPQGPQPAAMGHLQTLADLIDDWTMDHKGRMWWGDKTHSHALSRGAQSVRHAGTSRNRDGLGPIHLDAIYL